MEMHPEELDSVEVSMDDELSSDDEDLPPPPKSKKKKTKSTKRLDENGAAEGTKKKKKKKSAASKSNKSLNGDEDPAPSSKKKRTKKPKSTASLDDDGAPPSSKKKKKKKSSTAQSSKSLGTDSIEAAPSSVKLKKSGSAGATKKGSSKSVGVPNEGIPDELKEGPTHPPMFHKVSWFTQFYWTAWKNVLLLQRRPVLLLAMLLSSVVAVILSWAAGGRTPKSEDVIFPSPENFTDCGNVKNEYLNTLSWEDDDKVQYTLNDAWRDGVAVAMLGLGGMVNAVAVFILVHGEIQAQLLGVLRALGLRDSVYWMSWYVPFAAISFVNALLGAITSAGLSGHLYEHVYFGGVFASLLTLQLALVPTSFLLAVMCGTRGGRVCSSFILLFVVIAAFIPVLALNAQSEVNRWGSPDRFSDRAAGLFWENKATYTTSRTYNYYWDDDDDWNNSTDDDWYNFTDDVVFFPPVNSSEPFTEDTEDGCNTPVMNKRQGNFFKTEEERKEVQPDEYFVGCYLSASWNFQTWKQPNVAMKVMMMFIPYFHFQNIWGLFAGYTAFPDRSFTAKQASMTADELALATYPSNWDPEFNDFPSMAPQGSMFVTKLDWNDWEKRETGYFSADGIYVYGDYLDECAIGPPEANICESANRCGYADGEGAMSGSPTVAGSNGLLFALSLMYLLLAGYWASIFCRGNGRPEKFYFPFLPSYWMGNRAVISPNSLKGDGVQIQNASKRFGDFEAVKNVSFEMKQGEVTALLGHNGAGKSTLTNILCCEIPGSEGDIKVFGHSIASNAFLVRGMVGLCKQDDYLWPNLSAKEHLQLFAGLRGVKKEGIEQTVQQWLESVDLAIVQDQHSAAFSGGMKRRLSVALSTIGDRPLIVLDEPTTGMDPVSRRFIWRHIDAIKDGRVILLTTHAMEEADLLADEVAIMKAGELVALGSPLQLKSEHGTALQFTLLVNPADVSGAVNQIEELFANTKKWVQVEPSSAGNIVVKISALKEGKGTKGVRVKQLTSFVSWLDGKESPVTEYGFSNSSLEEVFLKVTGTKDEKEELAEPRIDTVSEDEVDLEMGDRQQTDELLASFQPMLSVWTQTLVICRDFFRRGWTGRGSIGNYIMSAIFFISVVLTMLYTSGWFEAGFFVVVVAFLSLSLVFIIAPVYADRTEGQFYLMQSQGLLPSAYLAGLSLHAFLLQLIYALLLLTAVYATPVFRDPTVCEDDGNDDFYYDCWPDRYFAVRETAEPVSLYNFQDTFEGQEVTLSASRVPGGYGNVIVLVLVLALASVGNTLTTAFFPGYRIPLVLIMFVTIAVSVLPAVVAPLRFYTSSWEVSPKCQNITNPEFVCDQIFSTTNSSETLKAFVNCAGFQANDEYTQQYYCIPPHAALLSQFGVFAMLVMTYTAKIKFTSEPKEYVEKVFMPTLDGVRCRGDTCSFPFASRLFGLNLLFTVIGLMLMILVGLGIAYTLAFPAGPVLQLREKIRSTVGTLRSSSKSKQATKDEMSKELEEVATERATISELIQPFKLQDGTVDHQALRNAHPDMSPVVVHQLQKVYPSMGGRPPKVALECLDIQTEKGQVLGLLGKNGAGKTTALKILAGAHDASSGVALVNGYDCLLEKNRVFEHLGNCAQFDVVWKGRSVQYHIEFFAALKGLPRNKVKEASRNIAKAVGLGSDEFYARNAGALSGGMRRRLSIAMSLIGSPAVLILDEPTTGLDPSTRSSIWRLINSFCTKERSTIITTHMMIEADTLCNRIAIMAHGKLVVVGTQQHLKNKFGSGYILQLNLVQSSAKHQEKAMAFVRKNLHPDATLAIRQAKTLHIQLPRDLDLEKLFLALYSKKRIKSGINQFLLSQSSLEDVFISLGD